ncbi:glycosyltransferase family 2 protein [Halomonas sp. ATBC28]|uniref:glycosyltransferase n=1 Tax=Halomonas sp. ATBC28 TaxID=2545264 RepID=UPI00110DAF1B|nr:glycosyltransferase family A protein [Halomonas sp. ATBC28]TMU23210.1 glycosyltransferase family 2 protein [Halomonas sp. ATBC28]
MKPLSHAKKPLTPTRSLAKQLSWLPQKTESFPKSPNSSLTIALISGERVYWSMQQEGKIISLTEVNWQWVFKYADIDLLLIESCAETATGDWFMAQTAPDLENSIFGEMVASAKKHKIPVAYWFTLDEEYLPQYQPIIEWIDNVFCADEKAVEALEQQGVKATYLPPAVQPALFTKLNQYTAEKRELKRLVCDDLVDVIQSWEGRESFYQDVQAFGGYFFDSRNQVWNTKTKKLELKPESLLGTLDLHSRVALFKESRTLGILKSASRTRTDMKWSAVEAAASHMTILLEAGVDVGEFATLCLQPDNQDQFFVELIRQDKDNLYYERVAQKAWREALMNHTYSHRVSTICQQLKIEHDWVEYPSAAMVTPSYREKFLARAKDSFTRQTYPNKHWVMVFNGEKNKYSDVKVEVDKVENSQAIYVPSELHAGPCMNAGFQKSLTDYVFRMDDDDYYGDNYLLDMILYSRVASFDVIGKVFRSFVMRDVFPNDVFYRVVKNLNFQKPSFCLSKNLPISVNFLAGCSQGGRTVFFRRNPYPSKNFGAVDSQWLDGLRKKDDAVIICVDDLNMVVDRRGGSDHTWDVDMKQFLNNSRRYKCQLSELMYS